MKLQNGEKIHTQNIGNTHKLVIANVAEEDFGQYSCKASNLLEKDVSRKLIVTGILSNVLTFQEKLHFIHFRGSIQTSHSE